MDMRSSRRNLLLGLGGIVATSGALVGTGALNAFTAQREANIPITTDNNALVSIELGPNESGGSGSILQQNNGTLGIDFTAPSGSDGVQPDATYQLGGIDETKPPVDNTLSDDTVAGGGSGSSSGFPSIFDTGNDAQNDPAILVRNNSTDLLGISATFYPADSNSFPSDGRVLIVTHDRGSSVDGDNNDADEMRAKMHDYDGQISSATNGGTAWRPAPSGESIGISIWIYTGTDLSGDLSGEIQILAVDDNGGVIGDQ
jgi:hypothetical protein